jgi:two-component system response regulator (stage 0 sporulation protein F)
MASVLFIDDDENIRFLVQEDLSLEGHLVRVASTGAEGLEAVEKDPPDVVILDVKMPGIGGLEVLRRIKEKRPGLPVLLFTAYDGYRDEALDLGADGYFIKSPDLSPVKDAVSRLAGANGGGGQSRT